MTELKDRYPRLPEELDHRRKLMSEDIDVIRRVFQECGPYHNRSEIARLRGLGLPCNSERHIMLELAQAYSVSCHTIYYWIKDTYREHKREQNAAAHSKENMDDYKKHKADELRRRAERWKRYDPQRVWHARTSARNEKRAKRRTVLGEPL